MYIVTALLSELLTNNAAAAIMCAGCMPPLRPVFFLARAAFSRALPPRAPPARQLTPRPANPRAPPPSQ